MAELYIAIVHFPVLDKTGRITATSVNSMEIHDMARICMTFGIDLCYIVTPLTKQKEIMERLIGYWTEGPGCIYNEERGRALKRLQTAVSIEEMIERVKEKGNPFIIGTSARERHVKTISYDEVRNIRKDTPVLILFGTGYGLTDGTLAFCDGIIPAIKGVGDFNHLSVRVAAGILIDRILRRGGFNE